MCGGDLPIKCQLFSLYWHIHILPKLAYSHFAFPYRVGIQSPLSIGLGFSHPFCNFIIYQVLGKELSTAAKDGSTHRILVFAATKKDVDEVLSQLITRFPREHMYYYMGQGCKGVVISSTLVLPMFYSNVISISIYPPDHHA